MNDFTTSHTGRTLTIFAAKDQRLEAPRPKRRRALPHRGRRHRLPWSLIRRPIVAKKSNRSACCVARSRRVSCRHSKLLPC